MRSTQHVITALAVILVSGCGDTRAQKDFTGQPIDGGQSIGDLAAPDGTTSDSNQTTDSKNSKDAAATDNGEAAPDSIADTESADTSADTVEPGCEEGGCFGDPCDGPDDCWSGFCVPHLGDKVCSDPCDTECPPGFSCQLISEEGSDPAYVCVSSVPHLCQPCTDSDQCDDAGLGAACVSYGDSGMFCGGACNETPECPAGFSCELATTASGGASKQCVAQSGICACSDLSIELALSTVCAATNEEGSCPGERFCGPEGLTECDAQPASEEICDGVDNNCDGLIDEDVDCADNDPCTTDTCMGPDGCVQAIALGASCDDGDIKTGGDVCTEDGNCAGKPIECPPIGPCITQSTPNGEGCDVDMKPEGTLCDDEDVGTTGDACDDSGVCAGTPYNCADEPVSACIVSYVMDGNGCVPVFAPLGTLCDDDKNDTKDDVCDDSGTCTGTPYNCDDKLTSICTPNYVPDGVGCTPQMAPVFTPCEDANDATKNDVCNGAGGCGGALYDCADEATTACTPTYAPDGEGCIPQHAPQGTLCDDGNIMTKNDVCNGAGGCAGTAYDCADQVPDVCTPGFITDGVGCAPQYAPQGTNCMDANNNTKNDVCDGAGTCAGTPYNCGQPTNACLPSYTADGFGCNPQYAPPGTPCNDNQMATFNDQCNGGGSCSGTPCTSRTITFGNHINNSQLGSVNLWFPGQQEQVYLQSNAGRKAWVRVKYSETCNDAYVEMVSPSQHTNMCFNHGMQKCAPLKYVDLLGAAVSHNCMSNINWWFDGQKKSLGDIAGCDPWSQLCNITGGQGKLLYLQNTTMLGCHNACNGLLWKHPACSCTWMGYDVKP